ncbi:MAG: SDR family oxidoreductase [Sphingomonadales bacterium]|nr:SDR family oxidoreductase [Sphingomonadales bacterium]
MSNIATANPMDMSSRTVLVTGASAGIGRAVAILMSQLGARVILNGRNEERLNTTLENLSGEGHIVAAHDLSDMNGIAPWMKSLGQEYGPMNGVVHCAGIQVTKPVRIVDEAFFDETMRTNLGSALALARGFRQKACKGSPASMVFVSSVSGFIGQPGNAVYAASKGGLLSAMRALAIEFLRDDIRVNAVAPALVETEMAQKARDGMTADQYQYMLDQHPMGIGKPEDVANAIAFLLSDASRWINAVTLPVEGAYLAR